METLARARKLSSHAVEKVWGRRDFPAIFGNPSDFAEPVGEIWFEDEHADELLIKYLFTSDKLSVQVHPSDEQARAVGQPRGKTEAWFVLTADPGATIGAGLDRALTSEELRAAAHDGSIKELLTWHPVKPGDFFFVPAGTVHAIGAGVSLVEIQQNVDLTYRLYDYGRPRGLQIEESVAVSNAEPFVHTASRKISDSREILVEGPKFVIEKWTGPCAEDLRADDEHPIWLIPITDGCQVADQVMLHGTVWLADNTIEVRLGESDCLLVAYAGDLAIA